MPVKDIKDLSDGHRLFQVTHEDGRLTAILSDTEKGAEWRSPLLTLSVIDRMQERQTRVSDFQLMRAAVEETGLHIILRNVVHGITLGAWFAWEAGELGVLVPPTEVEEANPELYRVHSIDVLPELMSCGADGTMFLPINTGVICSPANKPKVSDRFLIYGEQERWELMPTLPICGVQTGKGGLLCLASRGDCDAWFAVSTDGDGHGQVGMGTMFRRHWIDPVDWEQREFRYALLGRDADVVASAAKRVRRHVIDDYGKPTLRQRAEESPECAYHQGAFTMKLFHGLKQQGIMMYGREAGADETLYKRVMTFKQAESCMRRLHSAGLERISLQSVGWNPGGHDGAWPTCFPIDHRLGGESALRSMVETAKGLGYRITAHLNCGMSCFSSPDFNPDYVVHDLWGGPKVTGDWAGGIHGTHWGLALPDGWLETRMRPLQRLGFNGMQYLDFQGNPLTVNYHPQHRGPRADFARGIRRYQEVATEIFGAVQIEAGFLYCAVTADAVCGPFYHNYAHGHALQPNWPVVALIDRHVPAWQLAMHDLVTSEQLGVGWIDAMTCVLFGRIPRDEWSAEPGVMPVLDDDRVARLKAIYDLCVQRYGYLVSLEMTEWRALDPQIEQTRFEDGTEVVVDYRVNELFVNGDRVSQPASLRDEHWRT